MSAKRNIDVYRLGAVPYAQTLALQEQLQAARIAGSIGDTLLLLEHNPPVITMGRAAKNENVLVTREALAELGFDYSEIGRGGDVTYHGPGQLVAYPIFDLKPDREDVRKYVWSLEEAMIRTVGEYGVAASRVQGLNGTWVGNRKIGAVGVRISRWVTMHGLALNVSTNLADFQVIVPCGIRDRSVTSLHVETDRAPSMRDVEEKLALHLATLHEATLSFHDGAPHV